MPDENKWPRHAVRSVSPPQKKRSFISERTFYLIGGEAEIRTLGGLAPSTVFKTAALNRSATSPAE